MKRTTIDGQVFIVKACKDCPHLAWGEDDYFCNHYNSEYRGGYIIVTGEIDPDCPLADYDGDCKEELEEPRKSELLPCPFCGGEGELVIANPWDPYEAHVKCTGKCRIKGPSIWMVDDEKFKMTAVRLWNRRVNE